MPLKTQKFSLRLSPQEAVHCHLSYNEWLRNVVMLAELDLRVVQTPEFNELKKCKVCR